MPKRFQSNGNYAQTLAYRGVCALLVSARRAKQASKRDALARATASAQPFACLVSKRRAQRAAMRKARRSL